MSVYMKDYVLVEINHAISEIQDIENAIQEIDEEALDSVIAHLRDVIESLGDLSEYIREEQK